MPDQTILLAREGGEFVVNTTTDLAQTDPRVARLAAGGFVAIWIDESVHGYGSSEVRAQVFNSAGLKVGAEIAVSALSLPGNSRPAVTALASGGFAIVWEEYATSSTGRIQIFDAGGNRVGSEIVHTPGTTAELSYELAGLAGGGFVLVRSGGTGQIYDSAGRPLGPEIGVTAAERALTTVASLANGNFAVAAVKTGGGSTVQLFDRNGVEIGAEITTTGSAIGSPLRMAALENGGFVLVWHSVGVDGQHNRLGVMARVFAADGTPVGGEFLANTTTYENQGDPSVVGTSGGGFIVTWTDWFGASLSSNSRVWGQVFASTGAKVGTEFLLSREFDGPRYNHGKSAIAPIGGDRFVVLWHGAGPGDGVDSTGYGTGIRGQILEALGPVVLDVVPSSTSISEIAFGNVASVSLAAASPAINAIYSYEFVSESTGGALSMSGKRIFVADNSKLDHETAPTAAVTVRVTDNAGNVVQKSVEFAITDAVMEVRYTGGTETVVGGDAAPSSADASVASLPGGGFVVTWVDRNTHNEIQDTIRAQVYDRAGAKVGAEVAVNTTERSSQFDPSLAVLAFGGYAISWTDRDYRHNIRTQLFDAAGAKLGGEIIVRFDVDDDATDSYVAALSNGGVVVGWTEGRGDGSSDGVRAQLFDASGGRVGSDFLVNTATTGRQAAATFAGLPDGGFIAVWHDFSGIGADTSNSAIKAQLFDAAGGKLGAEIGVNSSYAGYQVSPSVAVAPGGNIFVTWLDGLSGAPNALKGQLLDPSGSKVGAELLLDQGIIFSAGVGPGPNGGFAVSWTANHLLDGDGSGVFGMLLDAGGARVGDVFLANQNTQFSQGRASLAVLTDGTLAGVWTDFLDIKLRLFTITGARDDSLETGEAGLLTGSLFADNGSGMDRAEPLQVTAVNGAAAAVGQQISLASGAKLTVKADGSVSYDPAGAHDALAPAGSGAANTRATDTFTYSVTGGSTATVTIAVAGSESPGDRYLGSTGGDAIVGTAAANLFLLHQGGGDRVTAAGGNDVLFFGGALDEWDLIDGGEGADTLVLQGNYPALVLGPPALTGIEGISLQSGSVTRWGGDGTASYHYNLTLADAVAPPGLQLRINAQSLMVGEGFTLNGSAETDGGRFLVYAGFGIDALTGGSGNDIFFFEAGRLGGGDRIVGGAGNDAVVISGAPAGASGPVQVTIAAGTLTSVESLSFNGRFATDPAAKPSYSAVMENGNIAAGAALIVNGSSLGPDQSLSFDGAAVVDGRLRIFGGAGGDALTGGAGDDVIEGGAGGDALTSGLGRDVFIYRGLGDSSGVTCDLITDFHFGNDRIDLSLVDADITTDGDQAFGFIGFTAFSGKAGELRVVFEHGVNAWALQGDVNGDGVTDFQLYVSTGAGPPPEADLIL